MTDLKEQAYEYHRDVLNENLRDVTERMLHLTSTGQQTSPEFLRLATAKMYTEAALRELKAEHKEAQT